MDKKMISKIKEEINEYAREEWEDFSYSIDKNGIITESYSGDGEYGHIAISTGSKVSITADTEELLRFFNGDNKFVEIIKDTMTSYCRVDEYEGPEDDPEAFMAWFNSAW